MKSPYSYSFSSFTVSMQVKLSSKMDYSMAHENHKICFNKSNNLLCDDEDEIISDSETNGLNIDVFEVEDCQEPKRKRIKIDNSTVLQEMEEIIEEESNDKAEKTNLSITNVKNVIESVTIPENRKLISNNSDERISYEPKLTRAKAKELAMLMPDLLWPLTPAKKEISSQIQALVKDDLLHEDSSDDEYDPTNDDEHQPSEDEGDNLTCSDIESESLTPALNLDANKSLDINHTNKDFNDSNKLFKVPESPFQLTEEESIGQRTRSKLRLNQTAIEDLQLVAPDIPPDMDHFSYLMDDPNWGELYLTTEHHCEDDVEADPNYNIQDDYETVTDDKEELRSDKGVKVTKKEMKSLYLSELKEFINFKKPGVIGVESKKKKSLNNYLENSSLNNSINDGVIELESERDWSPEVQSILNEEQYKIIAMQLEQHVQLMAQHFLMSYMHPVSDIHNQSTQCKDNLKNLVELQKPNLPLFNITNLPDAMELVNKWEEKLNNEEELRKNYVKYLENDVKIEAEKAKKKHIHMAKFNPELSKIIMESKALMYSNLLPEMPFRAETLNHVINFPPKSEDNLIAICIERYMPYNISTTNKILCSSEELQKNYRIICKELMPHRTPDYLRRRVNRLRDNKSPDNPVKFFFKHGYVPPLHHDPPLNIEKKAPKNQEFDSLPKVWRDYLAKEKTKIKNNSIKDLPVLKKNNLTENLSSSSCDISTGNDLQNPTVSTLPNVNKKPVEINDIIFFTISGDLYDNSSPSGINLNTSNIFINENIENENSSMFSLSLETPVIIDDSVFILGKEDTVIEYLSTSKGILKEKLVENSCSDELDEENEDKSAKKLLILDETSGPNVSVEKNNDNYLSVNSDDSSKEENDDGIAESMLDTPAIEKDIKNCGKIKENHEKEGEEELSIKFAESYIKRLYSTLKSSDPKALKNVIKYYLEYRDELKEIKDESQNKKEKLAFNFHKNVSVLLKDYPKLCSDVLPFFSSQQVEIIDKINEDLISDLSKINKDSDCTEKLSESETDESEESEDDSSRPWSRQEDAILLENIKDYSDNIFVYISKLLGDRTPDEVEKRWIQLYGIFESLNC